MGDDYVEQLSEDDIYKSLVALVAKLVVLYGVPYVITLLESLTKEKIDINRIDSLLLKKEPKEYFKHLYE